ncbi:MAG TPA: circadian clock protein KaiC [Candidatus Sulfotelmatobacter sp.]|nr:circadian clock protein KaiC [Candidatus Sulfotelmatobacter sp.]
MSRVRHSEKEKPLPKLEKALTGITGFDQITHGGLPQGRPTIVCGGPGCGKTMFAMEFLVRGATEFNEPGVLMTFEETGDEMTKNVASLGFDLKALAARKKIMMDYVKIEPAEIQETGAYDLEGLFVRLQYAVDKIGAKRIVLDTLEAVFSGFNNSGLLRAEIRRLFRWLKDRGLTTVVTAERGDGALTRYGLEEYVSDCVIFLDHRVNEQVSTRRMRIVKYRGTSHGGDEYPFVIDERGFSVLPSTSMRLDHKVSSGRISSGVPDLDNMLEGEGFYKGSSILVSGTAGSGKSSLGASFADRSGSDGRKTLYVAFEESPLQAVRNMRSIGINLEKHLRKGILKFDAWRPTQSGLEMHLLRIHKLVEEFEPEVVVIDPVSNLMMGNLHEVHSMLMRLIDFLKTKQITAMFTSLTQGSQKDFEQTDVGISSLIDTWILVRDVELSGERNRCIYVLKSRGMDHSNQVREFVISRKGIRLLPVYIGDGSVLTGSARLTQEAREKADALVERQTAEEQARARDRRRKAVEAQIASLRLELTDVESESARFASEELKRELRLAQDKIDRSALRGGKSTLAGRAKRG